MNETDFIKLVRKHTAEYNTELYITKGKRVNCTGMRTNGYFDHMSEPARLAVATGDSAKWFWVFVHEYCHFNQWIEQCAGWLEYEKYVKHWDVYASGICPNVKGMDVIKEFQCARDLELDCEKRVVRMIKKYNLPIKVEDYIRNANAYVYFYSYVRDNARWYKVAPYRVKEILKVMPTKFLTTKQYDKLPSGYVELIEKYCL